MSAVFSLKNRIEFDKVYKNGRSIANRLLVMYYLPNGLTYNRYGISVSKKVGNSVVRHRATRLIRESIRLCDCVFNSGLDIVVVARTGIRNTKFVDVDGSYHHLLKLARLIKSDSSGLSVSTHID